MLNENNRCSLHPNATVFMALDNDFPVCEVCDPKAAHHIRDNSSTYYFMGGKPPVRKDVKYVPIQAIRTLISDDGVHSITVKYFMGADNNLRIISILTEGAKFPTRISECPENIRKYVWGVLEAHYKELTEGIK